MKTPIAAFPAETIATFLERQGAPVTTSAIATRFGWERREADRRLRALERGGTIASRFEAISWTGGGGRSKVWFVEKVVGND